MAKLTHSWDTDIFGRDALKVEKKRGKITIEELEDYLRYDARNVQDRQWVMVLNCTESTCGGSGWMDEKENPGDTVLLYEYDTECPLCGKDKTILDLCGAVQEQEVNWNTRAANILILPARVGDSIVVKDGDSTDTLRIDGFELRGDELMVWGEDENEHYASFAPDEIIKYIPKEEVKNWDNQ